MMTDDPSATRGEAHAFLAALAGDDAACQRHLARLSQGQVWEVYRGAILLTRHAERFYRSKNDGTRRAPENWCAVQGCGDPRMATGDYCAEHHDLIGHIITHVVPPMAPPSAPVSAEEQAQERSKRRLRAWRETEEPLWDALMRLESITAQDRLILHRGIRQAILSGLTAWDSPGGEPTGPSASVHRKEEEPDEPRHHPA